MAVFASDFLLDVSYCLTQLRRTWTIIRSWLQKLLDTSRAQVQSVFTRP